ncbi:tyrosine-type recombinase/integrase [Paenibacillus glycanilyticus]|uniref:Site-specific integrase n=1 Tax=Paenibacillus glycanilyticus TaxID=126569 RepID=A0ABQ6GCG2_9BACL|nr:site-specific integrase [Paenibacillus glycanilyticus]GLX68322.1 site-specific integrase [Paenibacillus glycanilyticus]
MAGSIKKDGNSWYFVLDLGKDQLTGKRIQKKKRGFKTKKEAQAALVETLNELNKGTYIPQVKTLYKDYLNEWFTDKKTKIQPSTYSTYKWLIDKYIIEYLGNIELSKLTPMILQRFYNELSNAGNIVPENIQKIHSLINNSLKRAERWGLLNRNVAALVDRPKSVKKEIEVWSLEEAKQFLKVALEDRLYIAFLLAVTTGMRQAEILGLRWKDVNFEDSSISVIQTLSHDGKTLKIGTKTKSGMRKVHLPLESIQHLMKHKRIVERERSQNGPLYENNDLIVCTSFGTPIIPRNLMRTFYRLIKTADVKKIRFHDIRHTHATLLLMQGVNPKIVAERLGHSDIRMTLDTYSHLLPSMQQETASKFGAMLFNN